MTLLHDGRRVTAVCVGGRTVNVCSKNSVIVPAHELTIQPSTVGYGVTDLYDRGRFVATQILTNAMMPPTGSYDTYPIPQDSVTGTREFINGGGLQLNANYSNYPLTCSQLSKWSANTSWEGVDKVTAFTVFELLTSIDPTAQHPTYAVKWNNSNAPENNFTVSCDDIDLSKPGYYVATADIDVVHTTTGAMMVRAAVRFAWDRQKRPSVWRVWAQGVVPSDQYARMRACGVECFGSQGIRYIKREREGFLILSLTCGGWSHDWAHHPRTTGQSRVRGRQARLRVLAWAQDSPPRQELVLAGPSQHIRPQRTALSEGRGYAVAHHRHGDRIQFHDGRVRHCACGTIPFRHGLYGPTYRGPAVWQWCGGGVAGRLRHSGVQPSPESGHSDHVQGGRHIRRVVGADPDTRLLAMLGGVR